MIFFIQTFIFILATLINLLLAYVVYRNNPRSATNRVYGLLSLVIIFWLTANYLSILPDLLGISLWLIRFSIFFATAMSALFFLFAHTMPHITLQMRPKRLKVLVAVTLFTMLITISPLAFSKVDISSGSPNPIPGPGMGIFSLVTTAYSILAVYTLVRKLRKSTGVVKQQLSSVIYGIAIMIYLIIVTILMPVVIYKFNGFVALIPLYTIIFLGLTTFAIIKHRLFDIRTAVARALAYILSLGTLIGAYGFIVFGISGQFFHASDNLTLQRAFYVGFAVISSLAYQPLKRFFDRITNRLFFRDAYEPQVFLDQLNKILVSNIELETLLKKTAEVIEGNIKIDFAVFNIRPTAYVPTRNIGTKAFDLKEEELEVLHRVTSAIHKEVISTDDLIDDHQHRELYRMLKANNIEIVAKLVSSLEQRIEGIGYLLLSPKKSGNPYSSQDLNIIEIIADELFIATENSLRYEEIEQFNITLQEKVDTATRQLRHSNEKLKALDETKDEFISMASHQLRTPLTSVKGYLSMVIDGDAGKLNDQQHKLLDQAFISSQRMVYLIADLLNVSRLRTGKFVIETAPTNLADLVEGEIGQLTETAKGRKLQLTYNKPKDFPILMLDETKIRQVVMNFADNAIYYTPAGGKIKVELEDMGETIEFRVVDNGLGVPKSEQPHLFTKFYRAGNAKKARPDGTGLGLFMAKKVVAVQGGAIIFKSQEGKGSTFGFSFAKAKLQPPNISTSDQTS